MFYPTDGYGQSAELAAAAANLADDAGIPLLVDLRRAGVTIDSGKDRWEDDTDRFGKLAAAVQAAASGMGLNADAAPLRFVQAVIDAVDLPAVREFWCAALGYRPDPRGHVTDIVDPRDLNPGTGLPEDGGRRR
jgi:hypothetical protein